MGTFGGKDVGDTCRRIMRNLLHHDLALQLNFAGRGEKTGIKYSKIMTLITG